MWHPLLVAGTDAALANLYLLNGQRDLAIPCAQRAEREMRDLRGQKFIQPELFRMHLCIECAARFGNRGEDPSDRSSFSLRKPETTSGFFRLRSTQPRSVTFCWANWIRRSRS